MKLLLLLLARFQFPTTTQPGLQAHPPASPFAGPQEVFLTMFDYIDRLFAIVRPRKLLYMAIGARMLPILPIVLQLPASVACLSCAHQPAGI